MKNYTIKCGGASLSVDSLGAQISSLNIDGKEYIWQRNAGVWGGSAPILFPIIGELKGEGKTTIIGGKPYHIEIHGFAAKQDFSCEIINDSKMLMSFSSNDETKAQYPFDYNFSIEYEVFEKGWKQTFIIENKTDCKMPYFVGGHPGFNCPLFDGETLEDYTVIFEKEEKNEVFRIGADGLIDDSFTDAVFVDGNKIPMSDDAFICRTGPSALVFDAMNSRSVKLVNKNGNGIKMDYPDFDYFGIWRMVKPEAKYVCLEPWTGINDLYSDDGIYEHKRGIRYIEKGDTARLSFSVEVI